MPKYFDQVDFSNDSLLVEGISGQDGIDDNLSYMRVITTTASLKTSAGYLGRVFVGNATSTTMKIYDSTTIIASSRQATIINTVTKVQFAAIQSHNLGWKFTKGIRVIFSTPSDVTFSYR